MTAPLVRIAGAGVLGLTLAVELAGRGWRVEVYDPAPDGNASAVAAGMLAPAAESLDPEAPAGAGLLHDSLQAWPPFAAASGIVLDRAGTVFPARRADQAQALVRALTDQGWAARALTRSDIAAAQPWLADAVSEAAFTPDDWRLSPAAALSALRCRLGILGVPITAQPAAVEPSASTPWVLAAGWSSRRWASLAPELAWLQPIKGQLARMAAGPDAGATVRWPGGYLAPQPGGAVVGATMEPGREDAGVDPHAIDRLLRAAEKFAPALAGLAATGAAGVRASTPDGLPLVGPSSVPGLMLATGARRNGWLLAPLVARIIALQLAGEDPGPHAAALDPRRFAPSA